MLQAQKKATREELDHATKARDALRTQVCALPSTPIQYVALVAQSAFSAGWAGLGVGQMLQAKPRSFRIANPLDTDTSLGTLMHFSI